MRSALSSAPARRPAGLQPVPAARNGYLDLLRVAAICAVVAGHWLLTSITYRNGRLSGESALLYISWSAWATLLFQVMPTFFLVGGYVDALSWIRHSGAGASWASWVRGRAMRLFWPTAVYVMVVTAALSAGSWAGVSRTVLGTIGWALGYQLWFLPVYLLLIALTPAMLAAHRRWGLRVPAVMAVAAAAVDVAVVGWHLPGVGWANYFLVWGSMYQWGFAWQDGTMTRRSWRPAAFAAGGAIALAALWAWTPFPVDMIGIGQRTGNTTPPSVALLAFGAAQAGLVIAAQPLAARLLARRRRARAIERLNASVMPVYLWHLVPVVLAGLVLYPAGLLPSAVPGTATWWQSRPGWLAALAVMLIVLIAALNRLLRPMLRLPSGLGPLRAWSPALLIAGLAATMFALNRIAAVGFAPAGTLTMPLLAAFWTGLALTLLSGRDPALPGSGGSGSGDQVSPAPTSPAPCASHS